jgi:transposase-like protein
MPAAKPLDTEKAYLLFHQDLAWKDAALALGVSPNRLRRLWIGRYGADAVRDRGAQHRKGATPEAMQEALAAFHSEEPSKKVAQRLGMSPNTLRDQWITTYGKSSLDERGTRLQAQGATLYGALSRGKAKKRSFVTALCVGCSQGVTLSKSQLSRLKDVICDTCKLVDKDTECPVCGLACKGAKGLATHFRHAGEDEAHRAYSVSAQERQWEGLVDGEDYVTCGVCGLRGKALTNHIKLHGLTAKEYEKAYPKFAIICKTSLSQKRINANQFSYDLTQDDLLKFVDSRGRVIAESAAKHFNCIEGTILRYCRMYGIPSRNNLAWQEAVLDQAKIYLKEEYEWEWSHPQAVNPETGRVFNYDGCFLQSKVVIEAHGDQHFSYSEKWHGSKATFLRMRERDTLKRRLVENLGYTLKVVRPSDPYMSPLSGQGF